MSEEQYEAYQEEFGRRVPMKASKRDVRGIGGRSLSIGEVTLQIPFSGLGIVLDIEFSILRESTPSLLCNKDLLENNLDISLQGGYLYIGERKQNLILDNYFFIHTWTADDLPFVLYTEAELGRIHRVFGHPSVAATYKLLRKASTKPLKRGLRRRLEELAEACKVCKRNAAAPRRFKLTVGSDDLSFNHKIIVDTMFIEGRAVLHIIDEATHFTAATFLRKQTAAEIWTCITTLWMHTYMGPPDFLAVDQGSAYVSAEFKSKAVAYGITMEEAPIESPGTIGIVERYHAPLRASYMTVRQSMPRAKASDDECLKLAVHGVNNTMGPEGLVPTLLVFGALPRPARKTPAPSQLQRQQALEEASKAVEHEQAKRRLAFALRHPSGPKGKEATAALAQIPPGSRVLVYRTKNKKWEGPKWEGPHRLISLDGETVVVQTERGRKIFRSVCVRPYDTPNSPSSKGKHSSDASHDGGCASVQDAQAYAAADHEDLGSQPRKVKVKPGSKEERMFKGPRLAELRGLMDSGTFKPIKLKEVPKGARIFNARFVDEIKRA